MKILKSIALFFSFLFSFRTILRFRKINKKLHKSINDREVDRIILKGNIIKMVKNFIAINTASKFIPAWYKSNAEIREEVLIKFGSEMKHLNIKIYNNLKLSA